MRNAVAASLIVLVACKSSEPGKVADPGSGVVLAKPTGTASGTDAVFVAPDAAPQEPPVDADQVARTALQAQIDASLAVDNAKLAATFLPEAIVLVGGNAMPIDEGPQLRIGGPAYGSVSVTAANITKLFARGTSAAVWFYAEVAIKTQPSGIGTIRVVELLSREHAWRAVAASFTDSRALQPRGNNREMRAATDDAKGLVAIAGSTQTILANLAPDAIVVGPELGQVATDDAAKAALAAWKLDALVPYQRPRAVATSHWGFVQANADLPDKVRVEMQVFAIPLGDRWKIVLAQYNAQ